MTCMPFGRWRGTPLCEVPPDYLRWLVSLPNLRDPLLTAVRVEVKRRRLAVQGQLFEPLNRLGATMSHGLPA